MTLFQVSYALLWILAVVLVPMSIVLVYLLAHLGSQIPREGSEHGKNLIGRKLPRFSAWDAGTGVVRELSDFDGHVHLVLAVSAGCASCRGLMNELSTMANSDLAGVNIIVLCMGDVDGCKAAVAQIRSIPAFVVSENDDSTVDLRYAGFPAALVIDEAGTVVDVRHPLSVKGILAAVKNAAVSERYFRDPALRT